MTTSVNVIVRFYNDAHHCGRTTDGRDFLAVGCSHRSPRAAVDHADTLAGVPPRKEDTDAATAPGDRQRPEVDLDPTSRSRPERHHSLASGVDSGPTENETPGRPSPAGGPRRHAPTGSTSSGPAGAPDLGLVP